MKITLSYKDRSNTFGFSSDSFKQEHNRFDEDLLNPRSIGGYTSPEPFGYSRFNDPFNRSKNQSNDQHDFFKEQEQKRKEQQRKNEAEREKRQRKENIKIQINNSLLNCNVHVNSVKILTKNEIDFSMMFNHDDNNIVEVNCSLHGMKSYENYSKAYEDITKSFPFHSEFKLIKIEPELEQVKILYPPIKEQSKASTYKSCMWEQTQKGEAQDKRNPPKTQQPKADDEAKPFASFKRGFLN